MYLIEPCCRLMHLCSYVFSIQNYLKLWALLLKVQIHHSMYYLYGQMLFFVQTDATYFDRLIFSHMQTFSNSKGTYIRAWLYTSSSFYVNKFVPHETHIFCCNSFGYIKETLSKDMRVSTGRLHGNSGQNKETCIGS